MSVLALFGGTTQAHLPPQSSDAIDRIEQIGAAWRAREEQQSGAENEKPKSRIAQFWNNWPNWNNWLNWGNWGNWGNW